MLVVLLLLKYITKICKTSGRTKLTCGIMKNGQYVWRWCFGSSRYCVLGWTRWPDEMWQVSLPYHTCGVHYRADRLSPCFVTELNFGFPGGTGGKEPTCRCRRHERHEFDPQVGKIPWRRACNPLQYSCLENLHGQRSHTGYSPWCCKESDMTEQLSTHIHLNRF